MFLKRDSTQKQESLPEIVETLIQLTRPFVVVVVVQAVILPKQLIMLTAKPMKYNRFDAKSGAYQYQ